MTHICATYIIIGCDKGLTPHKDHTSTWVNDVYFQFNPQKLTSFKFESTYNILFQEKHQSFCLGITNVLNSNPSAKILQRPNTSEPEHHIGSWHI